MAQNEKLDFLSEEKLNAFYQNQQTQSQPQKIQAGHYAPPVEVADGGLSESVINGDDFLMSKAQETQALIAQNLKNNAEQNEAVQNVFKPTNIRYLDNKLQNGTASALDAYMARKFLGIDLSEYGDKTADLNLNAKVKGLGLTTSHDKMYSDIDDGNAIDRLLMSSEGNLGLFGNIGRNLHEGTGGLTPTSQGEFLSNIENASKSFARTSTGGGRASVQAIKDAKALIDPKFRNENEYLQKLLAIKKSALNSKEQTIRNNIAKGVKIPEVVAQSYTNDLKKVAYLDNALKKGNFSYKEYAKFLLDSSSQVGKEVQAGESMGNAFRKIERKDTK